MTTEHAAPGGAALPADSSHLHPSFLDTKPKRGTHARMERIGIAIAFLIAVGGGSAAAQLPADLAFGPGLRGEVTGAVQWDVAFIHPNDPNYPSIEARITFPEVPLTMVLHIFHRNISVEVPRWDIQIGPGELPGNQPFQSFDAVAVVSPGDPDAIALGYRAEFGNITGTGGAFANETIARDLGLLWEADNLVLHFTTWSDEPARMT